MNAIGLIRYLIGYIEFETVGGFTDRFINLCKYHNVNIFNLSYKNKNLRACIPLKHIYKLKAPTKKSGVKLKFISQNGLHFLYKKHSSRLGLALGALFYIIFCAVMQMFIWNIDVQESRKVSKQDILDLLNNNGLQLGTYIKSFDEIDCSRKIVNTLEGKLQWMAINIKGSKAFVEIHDYNEESKDKPYSSPCNIIADFDGTLMNIEVFAGERVAKAGNGVNKGDLLISGIVENRDLSASFFEARGKISALHNVDYNLNYNPDEKFSKISDMKCMTKVNILGIKIPLQISQYQQNKSYNCNSFLVFKNNELPFGVIRSFSPIMSDNNTQLNHFDNALMASTVYTERTYKKFSNSNITDCRHNIKFNKKQYNIYSSYSCIDFMGVKQPINTNIF